MGKGSSQRLCARWKTPEMALDPECRICIKHEPTQLSKNLFWGLGCSRRLSPPLDIQ